jgi:hypothetical protein
MPVRSCLRQVTIIPSRTDLYRPTSAIQNLKHFRDTLLLWHIHAGVIAPQPTFVMSEMMQHR